MHSVSFLVAWLLRRWFTSDAWKNKGCIHVCFRAFWNACESKALAAGFYSTAGGSRMHASCAVSSVLLFFPDFFSYLAKTGAFTCIWRGRKIGAHVVGRAGRGKMGAKFRFRFEWEPEWCVADGKSSLGRLRSAALYDEALVALAGVRGCGVVLTCISLWGWMSTSTRRHVSLCVSGRRFGCAKFVRVNLGGGVAFWFRKRAGELCTYDTHFFCCLVLCVCVCRAKSLSLSSHAPNRSCTVFGATFRGINKQYQVQFFSFLRVPQVSLVMSHLKSVFRFSSLWYFGRLDARLFRLHVLVVYPRLHDRG